MKNLFFIFIIFLSVILMSYHSKEQMSCEELKAENRILRDSIASLQKFSSNKPEAIVEIENMNVVYRDANNPVKIAVPNSLRFSVMAPGLKYVGKNRYELHPTTGKEVTFRIMADMRNGETLKFEKVFRIEDIGRPRTFFDDQLFQDTPMELSKSEIAKGRFSMDIENYTPYKRQEATEFKSVFLGKNRFTIQGSKFSKEAIQELDNMSIGDTIIVYSIRVPYPSYLDGLRNCKSSNSMIKIVK
ncbi:hypothetical protein [Kordia sp.]|uniref:hypothetical protein n=1 Tax=Kordia sp. TaxID=1965332 RepID=UPI003B5AAFC2